MSDGAPNGRRRWWVMVIGLAAAAVLVAVPIWLSVKVDDQNERLSGVVAEQAELIARNKELVDRAEAQRVVEDERQAAVALEVCRKTNFALRTNRESLAAAEAALVGVLRMSPHSAVIADQVAAGLPPQPPADETDSDCDGDGVLGPADYAG